MGDGGSFASGVEKGKTARGSRGAEIKLHRVETIGRCCG